MKKFIGYILLTLILVSCGTDNGHFRIEGRFRNFNQGEFYIYCPDGEMSGIDTIKVADGRFAYETPINNKTTYVLVFPNFSEQPVFGEPGKTAKIKGDASHLKEMEIEGTDANKEMTKFRMDANRLTPPEVIKAASDFIKKNPKSEICPYLVRKHFIQIAQPDYKEASSLTATMLKADPKNIKLQNLNKTLKQLATTSTGNNIPQFNTKDINGKDMNRNMLRGKVNVIFAWATWSFSSQNIQRKLFRMKKQYGQDLQIAGICLDPRQEDCKTRIERDSIQWPTACDGQMWDSPIIRKLSITTVPAVIIADKNGKITARDLSDNMIEDKIKSMMGD
ncbi:DUF4369 domain-containing protein [Xylanibacter muris]|uniref:DUF4369 domain-containing protein n=1 Tax=Xylanibacter muris TaxID=2736290 RepID=A0ABX2APM8_9BACT|nr:DUF4369 domain-containing protein [Xylanibacter muris]NPD93203.1 DUF4369 domain-containing protein [Xylanibacter muris]